MIGTLVVLTVLTASSWAIAHAPLGPLHAVAALAIAAVKAGVVVYVFMEVAHAPVAARVVGIVTVVFISLLCLGLIGDVAIR